MKAAFVGLVGRPSAGKSTLLNRLCGHKISIISPVPQTTRNRVRGICNAAEGQLVFIDTPGFHLSERKMNLHLTELVSRTLEEAELVLYLVDGTRPAGEEERSLIALLEPHAASTVVALNKADLPTARIDEARRVMASVFPSERVLAVSALSGAGVPELLAALWRLAPEGERMYPEDYYTDQGPEFRITEIIREKAIQQTREELPHCLYVELSDLEMRDEEGVIWARGFIFVERESQKGILVGRGGERIKTIVRQAQEELAGLFPHPVHLDLRVKTRPKWRSDERVLRRLIS
jgi:GTP-binding protein Era